MFVYKTAINDDLHYLPTVEKIGNVKASRNFLSKLADEETHRGGTQDYVRVYTVVPHSAKGREWV